MNTNAKQLDRCVIVKKGKVKMVLSNSFHMVFNQETGLTLKWGKTKEDDPPFCPWGPELLDISMSRKCSHACKYCSPAGTKVSTVTGEHNIEEIKPGDKVVGWDSTDNYPRVQEVREVYKRQYTGELVVVEFENGKVLKLTSEHKVVLKSGEEIEAGKLVGSESVRHTKEQLLKVKAVTREQFSGTVYNFHCTPNENYFSENVLVHNCYQNATIDGQIMPLEQYCRILDMLPKTVNQIALGGGEPTEHPQFIEFLKATREMDIVPNFTTNGDNMTQEYAKAVKEYCGACAVSWHEGEGKFRAIRNLDAAGMKPNVHYLLSKETIDEATQMLKNPKSVLGEAFGKIFAVVFLLYKPQGRADARFVLNNEKKVNKFFELASAGNLEFNFGFDSCSVPMVLTHANFPSALVETCESTRYSLYIDCDGAVLPCSFCKGKWDAFNIFDTNNFTEDVWYHPNIVKFREQQLKTLVHCESCKHLQDCLGGCRVYPEIVKCKKVEK